jgi:hypothetical protein
MSKPPGFTADELRQLGMEIPRVDFADAIAKFEAADRKHPPQPGGILFVGDSDIRRWDAKSGFHESFAGLPVLNRGFGGARTWEVLIYFACVVLPYKPQTIVYCAGDNDIAVLEQRGIVSAVRGFEFFLKEVERFLPETKRVLYLGIHPSPLDEPLWGCIADANRQLIEICGKSKVAEFIDYNPLLHAEGKLRAECFLEDRLHFTPAFYRELGAFLRERLTRP